jgi:hypothetical protein
MGTEMNGESASVQVIACRFLCFVLAIFVYGAGLSCATGQAASNTIKSFHDDALNITYFYSADFVPASSGTPVAPGDESKCIRPTLFTNSVTAGDNSSFTFSTIDNTCPNSSTERVNSGLSRASRSYFNLNSMVNRLSIRYQSSTQFLAIPPPSP